MSAILFEQQQEQQQQQEYNLDSTIEYLATKETTNGEVEGVGGGGDAGDGSDVSEGKAADADTGNCQQQQQQHQQLEHTCSAVFEDILENKMNGLNLKDDVNIDDEIGDLLQQVHNPNQMYCDGSDSGVEIPTNLNVNLPRTLSSQSGAYSIPDDVVQANNLSCNSSMISCSSDMYSDMKNTQILMGNVNSGCRSLGMNYECLSENGSESSSVAGSTNKTIRRVPNHNNVKKKVAMFEPSMHESLSLKSKTPGKDSSGLASTSTQQHSIQQQQQMHARSTRLSGGLKRAVSLPRPSHGTAQQIRERINSTAKMCSSNQTSYRNTPVRPQPKPQKPDTLPSQLNRTSSVSMQRLVQRTPSLSRARTPSTPDDGRWPSVSSASRNSNASRRGMSVASDLASLKMRSSMMASMEIKSNSSSPYGTMPRRRKQKSVEDLTGRSSRSSSISRESRMTSSVIMTTSRKSLSATYGKSAGNTPVQQKTITSTLTLGRSASMKRPTQLMSQCKTKIYHEIGLQTAITSSDLDKAFAGVCSSARSIEAVDQKDQESQVDIRDQEMERLREEIRHMAQREQELAAKLKRERDEKLAMQRELHLNTERVMALLHMARIAGNGKIIDVSTPTSDEGESNHDSLHDMLESQIQLSGHELHERQQEIGQLRKLCRSLQIEMERSLMQQEFLMQEKAAIEQESTELQDFLQHEKTAMCDALKELESEYQLATQQLCNNEQQLANKDEEIKVLRDECRHLVRLNEQRRQENRMLQTKYTGLENKSKELMLHQNSSASGAAAALTGLHTRLDNLVEQLVFSYNISEQDLEDIGFQNDSYTDSGSGGLGDSSSGLKLTLNGHEMPAQHPQTLNLTQNAMQQFQLNSGSDGSLSPQRNQSFIAAVISAIRNATTHSGKRLRPNKRASASHPPSMHNNTNNNNSNNNNHHHPHQQQQHHDATENNGDDSDSTEMLDSETEPCLMMDNVLEDVTIPDSHSHNMVSSSCTGRISQIDKIEIPSELLNVSVADESLQNLSQAIVNRQNMESQVNSLQGTKLNLQLNEPMCTEDISCHDSLAEMPSLEYSTSQAVVDQVIEVDSLITKLLKVLRLIQLDNDNCIQQLIIDKNKLQQSKEDMLEKIKDLQDVNVKLQDELMDATQELMLKNNDLSNTKAEMQRHRNEIDRLTEDICNLSTLCSNYRKLSPSTELPPFHATNLTISSQDSMDNGYDDIGGILNLLKMWLVEGQLNDERVQEFLRNITKTEISTFENDDEQPSSEERLRIYANLLENISSALKKNASENAPNDNPDLLKLCQDLDLVKSNANWSTVLENQTCSAADEDDIKNAN